MPARYGFCYKCQEDAEFVAVCRMPDVPFAAPLALAVRSEVAERADVPSERVWASDRLPEEWGDLFIRRRKKKKRRKGVRLGSG